jgi:polysaccharide biosynthesis transport protein
MYQPLKTDAAAPPPGTATVRTVTFGTSYDGPERRQAHPAPPPLQRNWLATITPILILGWVRRYWLVVLCCAVLGAVGGYAAGNLIKPRYTSYSDILLDPNNLQLVDDDLYGRGATAEAQVIDVESKMRILNSISVLGRVVDQLNLVDDPDLLGPGDVAPGGDRRIAAILALGDRVRVSREERSYVVTASVWASTPEKSAALTDALVNAFLVELSESEAGGARTASEALSERLTQLRDDAAAAEAAVVDYRQKNGLPMTTSDTQLSTQSAVQLNTQVDAAREALIDAEARYAALSSGDAGAAAQASDTLAELRTEYAAAKKTADSLAATLGPRHPSLATAQAELSALQGEIDQEVARIVEGARTDLQRARDVFDQLSNAAGAQLGNVFSDEKAALELRQLERTAASAVAIYEAYLNRAGQVAERSQLNTSKVRVISPAVAPTVRSYPPRTIVLAIGGLIGGLVLGLALAAGLGFLRFAMGQQRRPA